MQFNRIIYKYSPFNLEHIGAIYFSSADKFNDPFDSSINIRYDKWTLKRFEDEFCRHNPNLSLDERDQKLELLRQQFNSEEMADETYKAQQVIRNQLGVCCFSYNRSSILMWAHYADKHRGICIGYNLFELAKELGVLDFPNITSGFDVEYVEQYPELSPDDDGIIKSLKIKSINWEYEEEMRIVDRKKINVKVDISPKCYSEIILGCNFDKASEGLCIDELKCNYPETTLYKAYALRNEFDLGFKTIL